MNKWQAKYASYPYLFFIFLVPFSHSMAFVALLLLLFSGFAVSKKQELLESIRKPGALLLISFLFWHLISLLWSDNLSFGLFDLQIKAMMLAIYLCTSLQRPLLVQQTQRIRDFIFAGLAAVLIIQVFLSFQLYNQTGKLTSFSYITFSRFMHPSYLACFLNVAILLLLNRPAQLEIKKDLFKLLLGLFFSMAVILLNSKAGIIGWFLVVGTYLLWTAIANRSIKPLLNLALYVGVFFVLMKLLSPLYDNRMTGMIKAVDNQLKEEDHDSSSIRIDLWNTALQLIKEQPFLGTGSGDVKDALVNRYQERGLNYAAEHKFNAHNQFLQTWLATGFIGLLLLLLTFIIPTFQNRKYLNPVWMIFIALVFFNLLVESMLEKQDGVVFFALFYSLFLFIPFEEKKHLNSVA